MEKLADSQFEGKRLGRPGRWIVAFVADWCPFCQRFRGHLESWRPPAGVRVAIGDVTDLDSDLWDRFAIEVVPTLVGFADGAAVARRDGVAGRGLTPRALDALARELTEPAHQ
ncbi:MAG: thioredoxin family protein [Thermoplasmata archaeon]